MAKIAITLPVEQLARVKRAVKRGRASSVSAYITQALVEKEEGESLSSLVSDLIAEHGEPSTKDQKWASELLRTPSKASR